MLKYSRIFEDHTDYGLNILRAVPAKYLSFCKDVHHVHYDYIHFKPLQRAIISSNVNCYNSTDDTIVINANSTMHAVFGSDLNIYITYVSTRNSSLVIKNSINYTVASVTGLSVRTPTISDQDGVIELSLQRRTINNISVNCINIDFYNINDNYSITLT